MLCIIIYPVTTLMGLDPIFARIVNCLGFFVAICSSLLVLFGPKAYRLYDAHGSLLEIAKSAISSNISHQLIPESITHSAWRGKKSQAQASVSPVATHYRHARDEFSNDVERYEGNLVKPY